MDGEKPAPGERDPLHPEAVRGEHPVGNRTSEKPGDHGEGVRGERDAVPLAGDKALGRMGPRHGPVLPRIVRRSRHPQTHDFGRRNGAGSGEA